MDAVYNRPFIQVGKLPVALGGYVEANYQYLSENGISEGHQFQMRRLTLFISSSISKRIKFLSEIEFEDGTKEINIEFASVDFEFASLLNFRGGVVMNPIGAFNQNHDGPKWEFVDRPISATQMLPATWSNVGFGIFGKKYSKNWVYGYELYLTNGFDESIISNPDNKTSLLLPSKLLGICIRNIYTHPCPFSIYISLNFRESRIKVNRKNIYSPFFIQGQAILLELVVNSTHI